MSDRGIEFFNNWVRENVNALPYPQENDQQAQRYAEDFIEAAEKAGVPLEEIEEDMGDIADAILEAMDDATDDEVARLAAKDD